MQSLLLVAHGSRREASNQEVRDLAQRLSQIARERFDLIVPAFLELAEPNIPVGVDRCIEAGATRIRVLPYFLSAGRHVATDIPHELEKVRRRYPNIEIEQSDYLGRHESIPEILLMLALEGEDSASQEQI